jgi:3-oxoadipate enol-lactonase
VRLDVEGATLDYDSTGEGPVVVQAHGMMSSRAADASNGLNLAALSAAHTLVRYDARAHGASTGRPEPQDYVWPRLATDLFAVIAQVAGEAPVDAIGASMGAATILTAAVRRPAAFRRMVLVIPPTAWETRTPQRTMYEAGGAAIERQGLAAFLTAMGTATAPPVLAELGVVMTPQVSEVLLPSVLRGAAVSDLPEQAALAALDLPVLLLPWVGDPVHPVSTAEKLAATLPDARMEPAESAADVRGWPRRVAEFLGQEHAEVS